MTFNISGNVVITDDRLVNNISGASGSRPASPVTGQLFFNTTSGELEVWNGSAWKGAATSGGGGIPPIWTWGNGNVGRLGDDATVNRSSPVSVVGGITDWVQVSAGGGAPLAIRANGTAWGWGFGNSGRIGDGTAVNRSSPVSVVGGFTDWVQMAGGFSGSAGVRTNGTAWCWGFNSRGTNGDNSSIVRSSPVSVVGGITDWVQISRGNGFTTAVRASGTAWAWGSNQNGRLGDNTSVSKSSPVSVVGGFTDWVQITAGFTFAAAVRANGTAWAWGANGAGYLGNNTTVSSSSPVSVVGGITDWVQVSTGPSGVHVVALRANGTAWAWGNNGSGRLGDNTQTARSSPVSVVGGFTDWVQVSGGGPFSGAVRANGTAWTWGYNFTGTLGNDTIVSASSPVSVVGGFTDWVQISAGGTHMAALRSVGPRVRRPRILP